MAFILKMWAKSSKTKVGPIQAEGRQPIKTKAASCPVSDSSSDDDSDAGVGIQFAPQGRRQALRRSRGTVERVVTTASPDEADSALNAYTRLRVIHRGKQANILLACELKELKDVVLKAYPLRADGQALSSKASAADVMQEYELLVRLGALPDDAALARHASPLRSGGGLLHPPNGSGVGGGNKCATTTSSDAQHSVTSGVEMQSVSTGGAGGGNHHHSVFSAGNLKGVVGGAAGNHNSVFSGGGGGGSGGAGVHHRINSSVFNQLQQQQQQQQQQHQQGAPAAAKSPSHSRANSAASAHLSDVDCCGDCNGLPAAITCNLHQLKGASVSTSSRLRSAGGYGGDAAVVVVGSGSGSGGSHNGGSGGCVPGIVRPLGQFKADNHQYIVLEFCPGATVIELMADHGGRLRELTCCAEVVHPLLLTLRVLHAADVVHRQIQPDHVLCHEGRTCLIDFLRAANKRTQHLNQRVGTLEYMAPEVLSKPLPEEIFCRVLELGTSEEELPTYDERCDVWSLGIMTYEALTGCQPFVGETPGEVAAAQVAALGGVEPGCLPALIRQHTHLSLPAQDFLWRALQLDPASRSSAAELLQHAWLEQFVAVHNVQRGLRSPGNSLRNTRRSFSYSGSTDADGVPVG